jgi:hypothetical protein
MESEHCDAVIERGDPRLLPPLVVRKRIQLLIRQLIFRVLRVRRRLLRQLRTQQAAPTTVPSDIQN